MYAHTLGKIFQRRKDARLTSYCLFLDIYIYAVQKTHDTENGKCIVGKVVGNNRDQSQDRVDMKKVWEWHRFIHTYRMLAPPVRYVKFTSVARLDPI